MHVPCISVIIPCYNLGAYLDDALDSVFAQTYQDFEVLIVDDGSTDPETLRILAACRRPRTQILRTNNRGLPAARNFGLSRTAGHYVCMLDPDDRLHEPLFEKSVAALDAEPSLGFVSHWVRAFGDEEWEWTPTRCDFPALLDSNTVNASALVRRDALTAVGGFDETFDLGCEDWDLWISLVEKGFQGRILSEVLFDYRRRAGSMSRVMGEGDTHPRIYERIVRKHLTTFQRHLGDLFLRRNRDIVHVQNEIDKLDADCFEWLPFEIGRRRDEVVLLEKKAARLEQLQNLRQERARFEEELTETRRQLASTTERLEADLVEVRRELADTREQSRRRVHEIEFRLAESVGELESRLADSAGELESARHGLEIAIAEAHRLGVDAHRAEQRLRDVHQSLSWRLTTPLRGVYGVLRALFGASA